MDFLARERRLLRKKYPAAKKREVIEMCLAEIPDGMRLADLPEIEFWYVGYRLNVLEQLVVRWWLRWSSKVVMTEKRGDEWVVIDRAIRDFDDDGIVAFGFENEADAKEAVYEFL